MTSDRRHRSRPSQPQLPLVAPEDNGPGLDRDPSRATTHEEKWRLDEQTRQIGRQGIAAARARLEATRSARQPQPAAGGGHSSGRAA
jgi:hypothetical protein